LAASQNCKFSKLSPAVHGVTFTMKSVAHGRRHCIVSRRDSARQAIETYLLRTEDYWNIPMECANSQNGIFRLSDENGAESLFLCFQAPISFRTFLDRIQTALNNQLFCWSFGPSVGELAELQSISVALRCRASN
jgi:hypothetical protein